MSEKLPEYLEEAFNCARYGKSIPRDLDVFTDAVRRYAAEVRAAAIEECALAAEAAHPDNVYGSLHYSYHATKKTVGDAIRALLKKGTKP